MDDNIRTPASAESGTFIRLGPLLNSYTSDLALQRMLGWHLPAETLRLAEPYLARMGEQAVSPQIHAWNADAEVNRPYVKKYNVWSERYGYGQLVTADGWKKLDKWGASNGLLWAMITLAAMTGELFNILPSIYLRLYRPCIDVP